MALREVNHNKEVIPSPGFFKSSNSVKGKVFGARNFNTSLNISSSGVWLEFSSNVLFFLYFWKNSFTYGKSYWFSSDVKLHFKK